jgi:hypothetical protein
MEPTTENPTSQEAGKSVLGAVMWAEVLRLVIAPRIVGIVRTLPEIENRQQLHRAFCDHNKVRVSYSTFSSWCEDLGIQFRKRIEVNIPGWRDMPKQHPVPAEAPPAVLAQMAQEPELPEERVEWDGPQVRPSAIFSDDGLPNVYPRGVAPPTFLDNKDYAN